MGLRNFLKKTLSGGFMQDYLPEAAPVVGTAVGAAHGQPQLGAAVGTAVGANLGARRAAGQQNKALRRASGYNQPYVEAGQAGLAGYQNLLNDPEIYRQDPGYHFRMKEALNAVDARQAARGDLGSSAHDRARMQTAMGLASQGYNQRLGQYGALINQGQAAAAGQAANVAQQGMNRADATAVGVNALRGGVQDYLFWDLMRQNMGSGQTQRQGGYGGGNPAINPKPGMGLGSYM